jgi:hypothetical protein
VMELHGRPQVSVSWRNIAISLIDQRSKRVIA